MTGPQQPEEDEMDEQQVPPPGILRLIEATNAGDDEAFVAAFTADARVDDSGHRYRGHDGIAQWNASDNIGAGMRFELLSWTRTPDGDYDVSLRATSRRFSGTGSMRITLRDGLIADLVIG